MSERTLFVAFEADKWHEVEIEDLLESLDEVLPDDTSALLVSDTVEAMGQEQVEEYVNRLVEALDA